MSRPQFLATGIGSVPFAQAPQACEFINSVFKDDVPFWPQLPQRSFLENMSLQFSQNFPGIVIDEAEKRFFVDTAASNFSQQVEACLQHYLDNDLDYFVLSGEYAAGLQAFLSLDEKLRDTAYVKGQIVGPVTFGLTVLDDKSRPVAYNADLSECAAKLLGMKARWQIEKLKSVFPGKKIIVFLDEPYLVSYGTSFFTLKRDEVIKRINEVVGAIHQAGALAGIHCCGNTDWFLVLDTDLDILSFDAFNYLDTFLIYRPRLKRFLDKGGCIAWGIVSNVNNEDWDRDVSADNLFVILETKCRDLLRNTIFITPSCGCGSLDLHFSKKVHTVAAELAAHFRHKYRGD